MQSQSNPAVLGQASAGSSRNSRQVKRRVLLIDDDVAFSKLVKHALEETGRYQVAPLHDSNKAEEEARRIEPDMVIADIIMAPRDGSEVLLSFQQDPELCDIPFIIMSAFLNNRVFPDSPVDFGKHDVLEKPMNLAEFERLVQKIEEELERQQRQS